eukprot:215561_1
MGNKKSSIALNEDRLGVLVSGFVHQSVKNRATPTEIILLCYKFYGHCVVVTSLNAPSISLQYAKCIGHFGKIYAIAAKNERMFSASQDGKPIIWRTQQPPQYNKKRKIRHHTSFNKLKCYNATCAWIMTCDIHKNETYAMWGGLSDSVEIVKCDTGTRKEINQFAGYVTKVLFMDKMKCGQYILACSGDGCCYSFDISDFHNITLHRKWSLSQKEVLCCDYYIYSENKILVAFCGVDGYLYIVDFNSEENEQRYLAIIGTIDDSDLNSLNISPNGRFIIVGSDKSQIKIYDISNINWNRTISIMNDVKIRKRDVHARNRRLRKEHLNGVKLICLFDSGGFDVTDITDTKFVNDNCMVASNSNGAIFYIQCTNNEWKWGLVEASHKCYRVSCLAVDNNILFVGSWDFSVSVHNLSPLITTQ